jgi:hypothetical protein
MVLSKDLSSCIPAWKNPSRMHGCKWGSLKVREREIQREHGGTQVESISQKENFFMAFKTSTNP